MASDELLLEVRNLSVTIRARGIDVPAVRHADFSVERGSTVAIVGESGSGKTVTASAILGLLDPRTSTVSADRLTFLGEDLISMSRRRREGLRGTQMSVVPQDAIAALNPLLPVGRQIAEMFTYHEKVPPAQALLRAGELMARVGIPDPTRRIEHYPHQFSGGMRQRLVIAMAIALQPPLVIADEATSALDVTTQVEILGVLRELRRQSSMSLVYITHDLLSVANIADQIVVMYAGEVVEDGPARDVLARPAHPYTQALLQATPSIESRRNRLVPIPDPISRSADRNLSCAFAPCCAVQQEVCWSQRPPLAAVGSDRRAACHFAEDVVAGRGGVARA